MGKDFRVSVTVFACSLVLSASQMSLAQGGQRIVRIPDGVEARCIDPAKDQISLTLRHATVEKSKNWLRQGAEVALVIQVEIDAAGVPDPISVPLGVSAIIKSYEKGLVFLPIEYKIIREFQLTQSDTRYTGFSLGLTMLNKNSTTPLGRALKALIDAARKFPLPNDPASLATGYLFDIANMAIDGDLQDQRDRDKVMFASMALDFDPEGKCSRPGKMGFERTGTLAIVGSGGTAGPGHIALGSINSYCWTAEFTPSFELKAAMKRSGVPCHDQSYKKSAVRVTNDYFAFVLNAWEAPLQVKFDFTTMRNVPFVYGVTKEYSIDVENAKERCRAHGIPEDQCL